MTPEDMDREDIIRLLRLLKSDQERHLATLRSLTSYAAKHRAAGLTERLAELSGDYERLRTKTQRLTSRIRHPAPLQ